MRWKAYLPDLFFAMTPSPPENRFLAGSVESPEGDEVDELLSNWIHSYKNIEDFILNFQQWSKFGSLLDFVDTFSDSEMEQDWNLGNIRSLKN